MNFEIIPAAALCAADRTEIVTLCSLAYEEPFAPYLDLLIDPVHIICRANRAIISHACFVTRWLQPLGLPLLRTAYVEAVATLPDLQGRGHASRIMAAIPAQLGGFDIAALSPSEPGFYARFGWESWRGPLFVRTSAGLEPSIEEEVMVLRLPRTPPLDLSAPLSIEHRHGEVW